ncbi:MAG TPA: hypothetical protein VJB82_02890 [Candidatus Peribacterales bacterium]|nr:hypothetical protein [Candidatus Peribacterales bacterium]
MGKEKNIQGTPSVPRIVPPHALALFRIFTGATLCGMWISILILEPALSTGEWMLCVGMALMAIFLILGAWFHYIAIIMAMLYGLELALMYAAGTETNLVTNEEQAVFFMLVLLLLCWSNADRAFSHTMRMRYGSALEWEDVRQLPVTLLKILIACSYLYIGAFTLWQPVWMNGVRLRSALLGSLGTKFGAQLARSSLTMPVFQWSLYGIKTFMLMLPFCLWIRSIRIPFIIAGLLMHIAIVVLIGKWWLMMLFAGSLLFIHPETVRIQFEKIMRKT